MITLSSDFGSPYPAAMRAVIARRSDAHVVDVAHDFPRQDVRTAAFWLREVLPYFPPAVHCAVIDPTVGSDRSAIAVQAGDHVLVGPDNGLLLPAARRLLDPPPAAGTALRGVEPARGQPGDNGVAAESAADELASFEVRLDDPESSTFHGRDVFAPAAAEIHAAGDDGLANQPFLEPTETYVDLAFADPDVDDERSRARGEVLVVDGFGNAITNVPGGFVRDAGTVAVNGRTVPVVGYYAEVDPGAAVVTVGSHGNVELAVNRGRGDDAFGVEPGDDVSFELE